MTIVLTFHRVVDRCERDHDVSWDAFRRLLDTIRTTSTDLRDPSASGGLVLSFDDGTDDHVRVSGELASRSLPAIFFVPAERVGGVDRLDRDQVHQLVSSGHVVGSHAFHHRPLAGLAPDQLANEVHESRVFLEEVTSTSVSLFAPPGGIGHPDLTAALRSDGYQACRTMRWGIYRDPTLRFAVPCLPVTEYTWRRGWIHRVLARHSLPLGMKAGRLVKNALPSSAVIAIRRRLHEGFRKQTTP